MKRYKWLEKLDIPREHKDLLAYEIEHTKRLPDYDLQAAIENNKCSFAVGDIENVLATIPGHNDEDNWHWVVVLKNGKFFYLTGGCDYTGWDCQSSLDEEEGKDAFDCASKCKEWGEQLKRQLWGEQPWGLQDGVNNKL